jgi:hypothetical protein
VNLQTSGAPAIDRNIYSIYIGRSRGGKKSNSGRHFMGLTNPAGWHFFNH